MKKLNEMSMYELYVYGTRYDEKKLVIIYLDKDMNWHVIRECNSLEDLYDEWCDKYLMTEEHIFAQPIKWWFENEKEIRVCMKGHEW